MRSIILFFFMVVMVVGFSCEGSSNEIEILCLPVNMTATIIQGTETKKIIADIHYIAETELIDHITWSNHQTHYFEYDPSNKLSVVKKVKVDTKVQEEMWFHYDGALVDRISLINKNLDYVYLEPIDSTYVGYITYSYEGENVVEEIRYEVSKNGKQEIILRVDYAYDAKGNLLSSTSTDPKTSTSESVNLTYDSSNHPFSNLGYYFEGESFVNNLLTKTLVEEGFEYTYESGLNQHGYPDIIYEKLGTTNTRIIRYSYSCN